MTNRSSSCWLIALSASLSSVGCGGGGEPEQHAEETTSIEDVRNTLEQGNSGPEVRAVFDHLQSIGYFRNAKLKEQFRFWTPIVDEAVPDPDYFGPEHEAAVRAYQTQMGLMTTGRVDAATLDMMKQPRCGHPDNEWALLDPSDKFDFFGPPLERWPDAPSINITFKITAGTSDMSLSAANLAMSRGATTWNNVSKLNGTSTSGTPNIEVKFFNRGAPPDDWEDFSSRTTAAYAKNKRMAFNDLVNWNFVPGDTNTDDLQSMFTHEWGHTVGIAHSSIRAAIMFPVINSGTTKHGLANDDLVAVKNFYRDPPTTFTASIKDIASGGTGRSVSIYAIGTNNAVLYNNGGSSWSTVSNGVGLKVAVGADGRPWVTGTDNVIWHLNASNGWDWFPGEARDIAVNNNDVMWAVGAGIDAGGNSPLYRWNGFFWDLSDRTGKTVAVDSSNRVWVIRGDGTMIRRTVGTGFSGNWEPIPGCASDIGAGPDNIVYAVSCSQPTGNKFVMLWNEQGPSNEGGGALARKEWRVEPFLKGTGIAVHYNAMPLVIQANGNLLYGI